MNRSLRYIIVFFTFVAAYIFIYWIPLSFIPGLLELPVFHNIIAALLAIGISFLVWKKTSEKKNIISYIFLGGVITGTIMFLLGFLGPIILSQHNTMGPLLGILITGPLGLVLGMIGGAVYFVKNKRRLQKPL